MLRNTLGDRVLLISLITSRMENGNFKIQITTFLHFFDFRQLGFNLLVSAEWQNGETDEIK